MANEKRLIDANALRAVLKNKECDCEVFPWAVDNAPTVDAEEVVHGQWEYSPETTQTKSGFKCPFCPGIIWHSHDVPQAFKFCPNCGAKMDGGGMNDT